MTKSKHQHPPGSKVSLSDLTFHKLNWLEYVSMGLGFWFLLYPRPYTLLFSVLLCLPVLGLLLNGVSGRPSITSLVEITTEEKGKVKYDVADFIDLPAWIILIRVLRDYEFESFYSLVLPGLVAFAVMLVILFATHRQISSSSKNKTWIYLSLIGNVCLYSFAGTYGANCVYDKSIPVVYQAEVVGKRIYSGRKGGKTYYVKVTPWGHHYDREEIKVSADHYAEIDFGQTVNIDLRKGLFNIPWYYIERESRY